MKYIRIIFVLLFAQSICAQEMVGKIFHINKIIGGDMQNTQEFTLSKVISNPKNQFSYGNSIIFNDDNTFSCSYSAPCGNDCFPYSSGTFEMIDDKHIKLFVKQFGQEGDCESKNLELNVNLGTYLISIETDDFLKLIKE